MNKKVMRIVGSCILTMLFIGTFFAPMVAGSQENADETKETMITIGFGSHKFKEIPQSEWNAKSKEMWETCSTTEEKLSFLYDNGLLPVSYEYISKYIEWKQQMKFPQILQKVLSKRYSTTAMVTSLFSNVHFNYTGIVIDIGLNSIGVLRNANIPIGMEAAVIFLGEVTSPLMIGDQTYDAGEYGGLLVGFLGFWAGEYQSMIHATNLTVIGYTGFALWSNFDDED